MKLPNNVEVVAEVKEHHKHCCMFTGTLVVFVTISMTVFLLLKESEKQIEVYPQTEGSLEDVVEYNLTQSSEANSQFENQLNSHDENHKSKIFLDLMPLYFSFVALILIGIVILFITILKAYQLAYMDDKSTDDDEDDDKRQKQHEKEIETGEIIFGAVDHSFEDMSEEDSEDGKPFSSPVAILTNIEL